MKLQRFPGIPKCLANESNLRENITKKEKKKEKKNISVCLATLHLRALAP